VKFIYKQILFWSICFSVTCFSILTIQASDNPRDRLDNLKAELDSLANVLNNVQASESNLYEQIKLHDQKISARKRLIRELENQKSSEERNLRNLNRQILADQRKLTSVRGTLSQTNVEIDTLHKLISRRAVHVYKKGGRETLKFLAAANNPGEYVRRRIYIQRIQNRDNHNLSALRSARNRQHSSQISIEKTLASLNISRQSKQRTIGDLERLVVEGKRERSNLVSDRKNMDATLANIIIDKKYIENLISDRKAAARQIEDWIVSLERKRTSGKIQEIRVSRSPSDVVIRNVADYKNFKSARGRLPWPIKGSVVNRFGLSKNVTTGTVTDNPGIDIRATLGDEIIAVQKGICTRITYLRGYGTTVLVEHGDGYYTVYAHLGDVLISEGETIEAGRVLGTVGTSGGAESPRLHFQVWHKREKQDPLKWLIT
jgi:murein hydrolase activator